MAPARRAPEQASVYDPRDKGTPDEWVPRHPALVRLTGRHPFNVEPPLPLLMEHGFITPASLHYVRNHGAVPQLDWHSHRLSISGLVDRPTTFTMDDLLKLPARELPVTLVCAGNRRKEENLVAQTIGFNWGAAGVSTSVWKGVLLRDVLLACGVQGPADGANHVCFVGVEKMPKGRYGTSITWHTAMDPACDVMLAYEQNGQRLAPDHGFPLRLIIPGYIGGRMIKWLNEISVTTNESDNYFHFNDNRVLPEHVTAEIANAEGWWYKPDYIINELNINSAIAYPGHLEVVPLKKADDFYSVKGYCYSGGGRKIIRVELSVDNGKTWTLTKLTHPEKPTEYGRYWCWCFWELDVKLSDLWALEKAELLCRGWDAAMNRQPESIVWNVMGMLNNSYFRVKVNRVVDSATGLPALKFQHPTLAGPGNFGGWFEEKVLGAQGVPKQDAPITSANMTAPPPPPANLPQPTPGVAAAPPAAPAASAGLAPTPGAKVFTMEEVAKHTGKEDAWFVVNNKVYNGTPFLEEHPGGGSSILLTAGQDCSEEFAALHSSKAWSLLDKFYIGDLGSAAQAAASPGGGAIASGPPVTLAGGKWVSLTLESKTSLSHDTRLFRFSLPTKEHVLGLPVGQHVFLKAKVKDKVVMRPYTPLGHGVGYIDFVIKVYFANVHPRFPDGGALTQHMETLVPGSTMEIKGPIGEIIFQVDEVVPREPVTFTHGLGAALPKQTFTKIGFIAGGSGITPVLQTVHALIDQATADKRINAKQIQINVLYANQTEDDILCREQLDKCEKDPRVKVWYTVDRPAPGWKYSSGFISFEMVRDHLPPPGDDSFVFMCGPPPMIKFACIPNLEKLGHKPTNYFSF